MPEKIYKYLCNHNLMSQKTLFMTVKWYSQSEKYSFCPFSIFSLICEICISGANRCVVFTYHVLRFVFPGLVNQSHQRERLSLFGYHNRLVESRFLRKLPNDVVTTISEKQPGEFLSAGCPVFAFELTDPE